MPISSNLFNPSLSNSNRTNYLGQADSPKSPKFAPVAKNQTETFYDMLHIAEGHRTSAHLAERECERLHGELDGLRNQHLTRYERRATVNPTFRLFHLWYITKGMQPHDKPGALQPESYFYTDAVNVHTFVELRTSVRNDPQYADVSVVGLLEIAFEFGKAFNEAATEFALKHDELNGYGEHGRATKLRRELQDMQNEIIKTVSKQAVDEITRDEDKKAQENLNIEFKDGKWQQKPATPPGEQPRAKRKYVRKAPLQPKAAESKNPAQKNPPKK